MAPVKAAFRCLLSDCEKATNPLVNPDFNVWTLEAQSSHEMKKPTGLRRLAEFGPAQVDGLSSAQVGLGRGPFRQ